MKTLREHLSEIIEINEAKDQSKWVEIFKKSLDDNQSIKNKVIEYLKSVGSKKSKKPIGKGYEVIFSIGFMERYSMYLYDNANRSGWEIGYLGEGGEIIPLPRAIHPGSFWQEPTENYEFYGVDEQTFNFLTSTFQNLLPEKS